MTAIVDDINTLLLPRYLMNDVYPYPEGMQLEFKKSFHINQHTKYRETMCAFLNTNGGHIIFGILDNCIINGCLLSENERDSILLFVDSIYTILKKTNGDSISKNEIKVYFEEISKNNYIIIISCYKHESDLDYQFLGGDSWVRMNASNMKTKYGKLYSVQDVLNMKAKLYRKHEEITSRILKQYDRCEERTIIMINDILINKKEKEYEFNKKQSKNNYIIPIGLIICCTLLFKFLI